MSSADDKDSKYIYLPIKISPDTSQSWSIRLPTQGLPAMLGKSTSEIESGNKYSVNLVRPGGTFTFSRTLQNQSLGNLTAVPLLPRTVTSESKDSSGEDWANRRIVHSISTGTNANGTNSRQNGKIVDSILNVQSNLSQLEKMDKEKWKKAPLSAGVNGSSGFSPHTSPNAFIKLGATAKILNDQRIIPAAHDARTCGSPESGIDCDDVQSPQSIFHEEQSSGIKSPAIQPEARELVSSTCSGATFISSRKHSHALLSNANGQAIANAPVTAPEIMNKELQVCQNAGESTENEDYDDLQIISVHSLAIPSPELSDSFSKDTAKSTYVNSLLPGCKRLHVRNIRTSSHGSKLVLVVESDYSRARPLPSWILNKPTKKKAEIEPIRRDDREEDVVEVKVKRKFIDVTPKKEIPRKKNCYVLHHEKDSSTSAKKSIPKKGQSFQKTPIKKTRGRSCGVKIENKDEFEDSVVINDLENYNFNENTVEVVRTRNGFRNTASTLQVPKVDRVSQLREKLRQKEADLEKIRKTMMNSFDDSPLG